MILQLSFLFDRPGQFDSFLKILDVLIEDTGGKKKKVSTHGSALN